MKTKLSFALLFAVICSILPAVAQEQQIPDDQKREFLLTAKVVNSRQLGKGVTGAWRLTLSDGTLTHDAEFQKVDESKTYMELTGGKSEMNFRDSYKFNIAAYELAKLLGIGHMMPVTVGRKWRGDDGAVSWWIPDVIDEAERMKRNLTPPDVDGFNNQMHRMRVFTELVYDTDRNLGNVLIGPDFKLWMIDFTRAFRLYSDLKEPKNLQRCDRQLFEKMKTLTPDQLKPLVTSKALRQPEADAVLKRRDKILAIFTKLAAEKGESAIFY